jgi:hypothetical protein
MLKKRFLLLIILISACFPALAQDDAVDFSDTTYWDFGLYASPDYNYRMISGDGENGVTSDFLNGMEKYRIGYTVGGIVTRQLGKRIYIQTGILYQSKGYKTSSLQDTVLDLYDHYLSSSEYYSVVRYNTIYIPVIMKVKLFRAGSVQFNLGVGVAPDFYINKSTLSVFDDHTERDITKAEKVWDLEGIVNLNINIPLSDKLSLGLEPAFRYNIFGLNDDINKGVKRNMYSAGFGIQLCYKVTDQSFYDYYYTHIYKKPPKTNF